MNPGDWVWNLKYLCSKNEYKFNSVKQIIQVIFKFRWFLGPSDQNELSTLHYYPQYEILVEDQNQRGKGPLIFDATWSVTYSKEVKSELSVIDDLCVGNSPILFVIKIIFEQFIEAESCQELLVLFSPHSLHHESRDMYLRFVFRTFLTAAVRHFFFAPR